MMKLAEGIKGSSFITAAGGNGNTVGIQVSGLPGKWLTTKATAPIGRFDVELPADRALGAIGDSALVDAFGLGAMAANLNPEQKAEQFPYLPGDTFSRSTGLAVGIHPYFRSLDIGLGTTARGAVAQAAGPMISLGILDRLGKAGRLGGGFYDMPVTPFAQAMLALEA